MRFLVSFLDDDDNCSLFCLPDDGRLYEVKLNRLSDWLRSLEERNMASLKQVISAFLLCLLILGIILAVKIEGRIRCHISAG